MQRLIMLEKLLMDCVEERYQISEALPKYIDSKSKSRHEQRIAQLFVEIRVLWWEYQILAKPVSAGLNL
jgi:hypothetical protein